MTPTGRFISGTVVLGAMAAMAVVCVVPVVGFLVWVLGAIPLFILLPRILRPRR